MGGWFFLQKAAKDREVGVGWTVRCFFTTKGHLGHEVGVGWFFEPQMNADERRFDGVGWDFGI